MNGQMLNHNSCSVLVVDDEPSIRTALRANFLRQGWSVEAASGTREAIEALARTSFDLVVSDIRMQDGDGFEILDRVRKSSPNTGVILLTAFGTVPEAVASMRDGAMDYLTKPISFDQLQLTAAAVMQRRGDGQTGSNLTNKTCRTEQINGEIIGRSPLLLTALQRARAAASTDASPL